MFLTNVTEYVTAYVTEYVTAFVTVYVTEYLTAYVTYLVDNELLEDVPVRELRFSSVVDPSQSIDCQEQRHQEYAEGYRKCIFNKENEHRNKQYK